jgi:serine phosphatase RsbU (regulator of sigma subunit)/Tfp pilus assembly protein PilF
MKNPLRLFLKSILLFFTLSFSLCLRMLPQNQHLVDSLKNVVAIAKDDTNKVKLFYALGGQYRYTKIDTAIYFYQQALDVAEKIKSKKFAAQCLIAVGANLSRNGLQNEAIEYLERALRISEEIRDKTKISTSALNIGICKHELGFYDTAVEFYFKAIETAKEVDFKLGEARAYNNLGIAYWDQGDYVRSIESYLQALKLFEQLGDKRNMSACLTNIGVVHQEQRSYDKAIEYYQKALTVNEELGDKRGIAICYINIGNIFNIQSSYDKAIEHYKSGLKLFEEVGNKKGIAGFNHSIGDIYVSRGDYDEANEYYVNALRLYEELGDRMGMARIEAGIANLNISRVDSLPVTGEQKIRYLNRAIAYGNMAIENAREMKLMPIIKEAASTLMTSYAKLGNYEMSLEFARIYIEVQDSIFMEDKTRAIQEMSARYETEKKQQQIELQESQLIAKDARIQQQKIFRNALIGGLVAVALIIVVIALAYSQKKKDNKKIMEQNEQILEANEELKQLVETTSRQKDEIISSILYAQKIQSAILPPEVYINELLNENFIFYRPKEIVSGDFYWIKQVMSHIILVSADCTGHGVPGAFMSMLGISCLNDIVQSREIIMANQILNELRKDIKQSLRQSGKKEESRDGIDIALCVIDKKKNILQYAGARNPLYLIHNNNGESKLEEIKADPMPVGVHFVADKSFTNHEIQLEIGDTFYIFSDGFADQNGGEKNYSFTREKFKKLLLDIHDQPMYEQKEILEQTLETWMGGRPQRDDILVVGVRV